MVKETPDTRSQCRITACLLHRKQKKKENSALYYYEGYGVMPSGFSCTSRESGGDKGVTASGAQHETDENTVLQRKLSSFLSVTVSGASQLLELRGGHDGHDSLGRARHAGKRKEGKKGSWRFCLPITEKVHAAISEFPLPITFASAKSTIAGQ